MSDVIRHGKKCKCTGTLFFPLWKSQPFWTVICTDGVHFSEFVIDWLLIQPCFVPGRLVVNSVFKGFAPFDSLVVRLDFSSNIKIQPLRARCLLGGCARCMI